MIRNALCLMVICGLVVEADQWDQWKAFNRKRYKDSSEEATRRKLWQKNVDYITQHNKRYKQELETYTMALNPLSDLTETEINAQYKGYSRSSVRSTESERLPKFKIPIEDLPESVDWTKEGYVTTVKDQHPCGSSYSFSAIAALEGQYYKATKELIDFSEQQLLDCTRGYGNSGCNGGRAENCYRYMIDVGATGWYTYPYYAREAKCYYNRKTARWYPKDIAYSYNGNETVLKQMVAEIGPVAVGIAAPKPFYHYQQGIFGLTECNKSPIDHAVTVVGYGTEDGQEYWLVKNSWSIWWGDFGFAKIARNTGNMCFIASSITVPMGDRI